MTAKREGYVGPYTTGQGQKWEWKATCELPTGERKVTHRRGFATKKAAQAAMREALTASDKGTYAEPSKMPFGTYLTVWLDGLQLAPSTVASYRKNVRLHIAPSLGQVPLSQLTPGMLTALYRKLETEGRKDGQGKGLSPRTVRYIHTILSSALRDAAEQDLLQRNPAAKAKPPSVKAAAAPEMHPWDAKQLSAFLTWSKDSSELHAAWFTLAMTGMRRGEALALRWQDIDMAKGTVSVKRSATLVRIKGESFTIETGPTKSGKPRVIDLDPATTAVLKAHKAARGTLHLSLAKPESLVFGDVEGKVRHPEHFSRTWNQTLTRCRKALGEAAPPAIRLHDLRHTHATLMLASREPLKTVSERLGHASAVVTMTVYAHVLPGDQQQAAERFAALVAGAEA